MTLFSETYFHAFLVADAFGYVLQRSIRGFCGSSGLAMMLTIFVGWATAILNPIFLILGFWFMESWWHPIVCWALGFIVSLVAETIFMLLTPLLILLYPIANVIALLFYAVPIVAIVVMYLSLFNVI